MAKAGPISLLLALCESGIAKVAMSMLIGKPNLDGYQNIAAWLNNLSARSQMDMQFTTTTKILWTIEPKIFASCCMAITREFITREESRFRRGPSTSTAARNVALPKENIALLAFV